jgi:hypothetical protein
MATAVIELDDGSIVNADVDDNANIERTKLEQRTNARFPVNLMDLRVWDAIATNLPGTSASDDLGLITGTYASAPPYVGTSDLKGVAGPTTRYARVLIPIPHDYEGDPQSLTLRAIAGMKTTIADTSATLDVEVWRIDADGTLGASDLYVGAAKSINFLAAANYDYVLATTTLSPGDVLDVRLTIAVADAATATAVIAAIWQLELLADLR